MGDRLDLLKVKISSQAIVFFHEMRDIDVILDNVEPQRK